MIDWRQYWEEFPQKFAEGEFCRQVGRTANGGIPTPAPELNVVIDEIVALLDLGPGDRLLDLCCGNGLLTARLAHFCTNVVGVDFSNPMVQIARQHHSAANTKYLEGSVLELDRILDAAAFDKVCMVESLAYFDPGQLARNSSRTIVRLRGARHHTFLRSTGRGSEVELLRHRGAAGGL